MTLQRKKQHTILRESSLSGIALHTGQHSTMRLKPAPDGTGIVFKRMDLIGKPEVRPEIANVGDLVRATSIQTGNAVVSTVEHVLAVLYAMEIDNVIIELDGDEVPILDGSAKDFANLVLQSEKKEQGAEKKIFRVQEPITISIGSRSLLALPYDGFKITATFVDDKGLYTQHLSTEITPDTFVSDIAPARTFANYDDIEPLLKAGKIRGGNIDCAIIIKDKQVLSKEPLRFKDEFVRHKILDIIGDLSLLGVGLHAHIIAVRPGHAINAELTKAIYAQKKFIESGKKSIPKTPSGPLTTEGVAFDINRVLNLLPHRYPFVMIDRVIKFVSDTELIAVKNVTINEPYFSGHFPGQPVMPGVLQIEAMAQAAGILMLKMARLENQIAYFMSCDKVKFRRAVTPGDQLEIHVKLVKQRGNKIGIAEAQCLVEGKVVSSAELMFTILGNKE